MIEYEATGKTTEEAVGNALAYLGIKRENADIEVKEEPAGGILGLIGNKDARVIVKPKLNPAEYLKEYIVKMMDEMDISGEVNILEDEDKLEARINGQDVGVLIGRRGKTLSDLQYLLNVIMRRQFYNYNKMIVIDVENYRGRREKTLTQLAKNVARKVKKEEHEQVMEPMSPQERRIIHIALQDYPGITTYSSGEEPYRKVVIAPDR